MKYIITSLLIICQIHFLIAQITVSNAGFYEVNDILNTAIDNAPNINIGQAAGNQNWDFSTLSSSQIDQTTVLPASSGSSAAAFPNADIVIPFGQGGELYIQNTNTEMKTLGFAGNVQGIGTAAPFSPAGKFRVAPLQYGDSYTDENGIAFTLAADQIPFIDQLGLPVTPDSIRITQLFNVNVEVDAWGTVALPTGQYDALRLKKTQSTSSKIEAYVAGIFPVWLDVTDLVGANLPIDDFENGVVETYEFLADGIKESLAVVTVDTFGGNVLSVTFKDGNTGTPVNTLGEEEKLFAAYPNPAYGDVRIDVRGYSAGNYNINLYDVSGKLVQSELFNIQKDSTVIINVAHQNRGTYLYSLIDEKGKTLEAKRLMIIKP